MSISISANSLLATELYASLSSASGKAASTSTTAAAAVVPSTSTTATTSSATSQSPLVQDMTSLLQALATGNVSGAQSDLTKIQADLKAQESAATSVGSNAVSKGHGHHHHEAAASSADSSATSSSDSTSDSSSTSSTASPLSTLLSQISSSLSTGNTSGALQDLAGFLVQNGEGTGNLINTSA